MSDYATVSDIQTLKRLLTFDEIERARQLIPVVCSLIRYEAQKTGRNYDDMIYHSELVPIVDLFTGNGTLTTFNLSYVPQGTLSVTVNGTALSSGYTLSGNALTFATAPTGEILVMYDYRALAEVAKGVVCDVVMRELNTPSNQLPATTYSESAGSVSQSYTLPNASGAIKLWKSDLKALGLLRQKIDTIDLMTPRKRGCC